VFKKIASYSFVFGLLLVWIISFWINDGAKKTAAAVHILLFINLIGLYLLYKIVSRKKSIALGLLLIILKYPLLGYIVTKIVRQAWFDSVGLIIGFIVFLSSIVFVTLLKHFRKL